MVLVLLLLLIAVFQTTDLIGDHGSANVASWLLAFLAVVTLAVWFLLLSGYRRRVRALSLIGVLLSIGVAAVLFRVERISGELVPEFAFRFALKPDERMPWPAPGGFARKPNAPVDLLTATPLDFPQFLGPGRNASVDHVELARDWATRPARLVWKREIGAGWSAFSAVNGFAVTMEQRGELEMVTCYRIDTGELEWAHATAARYDAISGGVGPRSTPTIHEGLVYALGATGHLLCLDGATGKCRWRKNLLKEYGVSPEEESATLPWARSNSPLIADDLVIVPAGGPKQGRKVSLAAYNKQTGDLVWEGGNRQISYSSPALATLAGVRQILSVNEDSASAHDVTTGRVLWEHPWPAHSNADPNVSQPVAVGGDRVLLSKGYGQGAALLQIGRSADGAFTVQTLWKNPKVLRTKFANVAVRDGYAYGLSDGILECVDLQTGQRIWKDGRYRHGQILGVAGLVLVLAESGEVVLVEASPERPNRVLGRFQAIEGMTWNNIALYGPYLLVRNAEQAACYELPVEASL
ncbi:MAG: PQQ-like beta-propeller repeat protein [Pirellulales bacterium]|nr:PQQ-like beta-propeller repeat protein [Pirellulales bacterium]